MTDNTVPPGTYGPKDGVERLRQAAADTIREQLAEDQGAPSATDERHSQEPAPDSIPPSPVG